MSGVARIIKSFPKLAILLVFFPVAIFMHITGMEGLSLFIVSALGILGTVTLIGKATEEIAIYTGPVWGGLLNATFGNVTELIIALIALKEGMHEIVRASITGSILGNLLLVLGASMFYGGLKYQTQKISRMGANVNVGMLWLVVIALIVPSLVTFAYNADPTLDKLMAEDLAQKASLVASIILLIIYAMSLVFSLKTHRFLIMPVEEEQEEATWSRPTAIIILLLATGVVAYLSEVFVSSIEVMLEVQHIHISELFVGVVLVAIVGNAAEGSVAISVARQNKMELSFQIAMGSCLQVAVLVAPVLVIASFILGNPMSLAFNLFELIFIGAGVVISSSALQDGETNWLEGAMFLAVYIFFAIVFWFHP